MWFTYIKPVQVKFKGQVIGQVNISERKMQLID